MEKAKRPFNFILIKKNLLFFITTFLFIAEVNAQTCDPLTFPVLFGQSQTFIFCKGNTIGFGVSNSAEPQVYNFSVYRMGLKLLPRQGPLDGNGGQLSVSAYMKSAQDAGEYRVTTSDKCGATASVSFQAFYSEIDNLFHYIMGI